MEAGYHRTFTAATEIRKRPGLAFAFGAVLGAVLLAGKLGAVLHEEAGHAGEFVFPFRNDGDQEFFLKNSAGKIKAAAVR